MDVKRVGDHECISCGDCISVCPTKAISWKGSKLFVRGNDESAPTAPIPEDFKPITGMLKPVQDDAKISAKTPVKTTETVLAGNVSTAEQSPEISANNEEEAQV
jgi:ferredoxin